MSRDQDTEQRIFAAAQAVFHEQGFDGARMADIARRAQINSSMLHYYFRSKELLFEAVFRKAAMEVISPALSVLAEDRPLLEKLDRFVSAYVRALATNPHLPAFVLQELRRNPDALRRFAGETAGGVFARFSGDVRRAAADGDIRAVEPEQLITNLMGLCVFPFIARPMLQTALGLSETSYDDLLAARADHVRSFIHHALRP